eukprot:CAMPEP_0196822606 /NCGR_PEP_ID=MMETSP1362-20130617/84029_1 /TAXON_ID=163516 /ORGANISM="Leptocylindrus danicus, Strain CCMP1856" /LENGTH=322 /DNA_ID=CAMNT_0042202203 /DNA_START=48 /DNA_END=1013 /DNA_ORIENTATION=+
MMIPNETRNGLPNRVWMQRLSTSVCPGYIDVFNNESEMQEYSEMRDQYRQALYCLGGGSFPPLPDPSLRARDLLILMDVFHDGKAVACTAVHDIESLTTFLEKARLSIRKIKSINQFEVKLGPSGYFEPDFELFTGKVHAVRLMDYKIICIHNFSHFDEFIGPAHNYDPELDGDLADAYINTLPLVCFRSDEWGHFPTPLTSRLGDDWDDYTFAFFEYLLFYLRLPRCPQYFGRRYTLSRYNDYKNSVGIPTDSSLCFEEFRTNLWNDAASNPDLSKYFARAVAKAESADGKIYGTMAENQQELQLELYFRIQNRDDGAYCK